MARPAGAMLRIAAKSVSDPNNLPAVLSPAGVELELGYRLKQSRALIRLDLRYSAHTEGFCGDRFWIRGALSPLCGLNAATFLIAACARIHWAISLNVR